MRRSDERSIDRSIDKEVTLAAPQDWLRFGAAHPRCRWEEEAEVWLKEKWFPLENAAVEENTDRGGPSAAKLPNHLALPQVHF